jgi:ferric-chelate reductase (NADPH)
MASGKALIGAVIGRFLFREVETTEIRNLGPSFRLVSFRGESLRGVSWEPGDKIQVFLPEHGMRTYTPMSWDGARGSGELLVFIHGTSPGAEWGRRLSAGDRFQFFGPRRSIRATELGGPVVLFGDETSFGVARALADAKTPTAVKCVFEVSNAVESSDVLSKIGVGGATIQRESADAHLATTCDRLASELAANPNASLVMTGKAQSIQLLRAHLKAKNALRSGKVKAYWSVGKSGLD